jgi:hypothetical protein
MFSWIKQWFSRRLASENAGMLQQNMGASDELFRRFTDLADFEALER